MNASHSIMAGCNLSSAESASTWFRLSTTARPIRKGSLTETKRSQNTPSWPLNSISMISSLVICFGSHLIFRRKVNLSATLRRHLSTNLIASLCFSSLNVLRTRRTVRPVSLAISLINIRASLRRGLSTLSWSFVRFVFFPRWLIMVCISLEMTWGFLLRPSDRAASSNEPAYSAKTR